MAVLMRPARAILCAAVFVTACDCLFIVHGRVTDCVTGAPIAGVSVDVHIDRGLDERVESFPNRTSTDGNGKYTLDINDPCESVATLTFHSQGYAALTPPQLQGRRNNDPPLDVCLMPVSF
jgi:hypothetical protein